MTVEERARARGSGILLHLTSLPSPYPIGDLGPWAYRFVDFLSEARQRFWQILPLNPTEAAYFHSPYHSTSAFAFNPLMISPERLAEEGLLPGEGTDPAPGVPQSRVDYAGAEARKGELFRRTFERFFLERGDLSQDYQQFCADSAFWLQDFALFRALKIHFQGLPWNEWPLEIRDRAPEALRWARESLAEEVERTKVFQYLFWRQWMSLKAYANQRGIRMIGDIPIYVQHDSSDVWGRPHLFKLDERKRPRVVAGVPPDYFSRTGQLWGNPLYRWEIHKETRYAWWLRRIKHNLRLFDLVRIDHFRGLVGYWEVPAHEKTAMKGRWVKAPAVDFLETVLKEFPEAPLIAEDLGLITEDVKAIMGRFGFPGMKILLFAFGPDLPTHPYAPHNLQRNCIIYTGTHDNNTARGWFKREADTEARERLCRYLGKEISEENVHWELVRLAMMSVADTAIFPMQDILGLGEEARMNRPATRKGNWLWRLSPDMLTEELTRNLAEMTTLYGRA